MNLAAAPPPAGPADVGEPVGLLVVDDHELVRLGLRTLVQAQAAANQTDVKVFEARTLQGALDVYRNEADRIGLVLLDLHLPDAHGLTGLTTFLHEFPSARVVVLSGSSEPDVARQALARGARAFLAKSGDLQPVIAFIRSLGLLSQDGDPLGHASGSGHSAPDNGNHGGNGANSHDNARLVRTRQGNTVRLTLRQAELLDWILCGLSNREIAERAHLSEGTVKNHVSSLLLMFGVPSRSQLISQLR